MRRVVTRDPRITGVRSIGICSFFEQKGRGTGLISEDLSIVSDDQQPRRARTRLHPVRLKYISNMHAKVRPWKLGVVAWQEWKKYSLFLKYKIRAEESRA